MVSLLAIIICRIIVNVLAYSGIVEFSAAFAALNADHAECIRIAAFLAGRIINVHHHFCSLLFRRFGQRHPVCYLFTLAYIAGIAFKFSAILHAADCNIVSRFSVTVLAKNSKQYAVESSGQPLAARNPTVDGLQIFDLVKQFTYIRIRF